MAQQEGEWRNGLFSGVCGADECGSCMGAWCCSCFTFGRAAQRLDRFPNTDKEDLDLFNGDCCILYGTALCHLHWIPIWFKRSAMRQKFGIQGNGCTDCLASYFCACCAIAQLNTEVKDRAEVARSGGEKGYAQDAGKMMYQAPV